MTASAELIITGSASDIRLFMEQINELSRSGEIEIDGEIICDIPCPVCGGMVLGTFLEDKSLSYYCVDCDADISRGQE